MSSKIYSWVNKDIQYSLSSKRSPYSYYIGISFILEQKWKWDEIINNVQRGFRVHFGTPEV